MAWEKVFDIPRLSIFQFGTGDNNVLQLLLKPVLSLSHLFVFLYIMHELHLTDGPLTVGTVKYHS